MNDVCEARIPPARVCSFARECRSGETCRNGICVVVTVITDDNPLPQTDGGFRDALVGRDTGTNTPDAGAGTQFANIDA